MMSRPRILTSSLCIIITSLSSMSVLAFVPSSSPKSALSNLSPLRLKGSTTPTSSIVQRSARHPFNSALQSSSSDSNDTPKQQKSINSKKKLKKRRMSISKQSLTTAQKSNTPTTLTNTESEQRAYNELLPKTGYSLADSLEQSADNKELFETILTPIGGVYSATEKGGEEEFEYDVDGFPIGVKQTADDRENEDEEEGHDGIARIDTISNYGGREPVRWIVSLDDTNNNNSDNDATTTTTTLSHVMIDLPPYSDKLATEIRQFMNPNNDTQTTGTLDAILLTNQQCIHYDNTPGVYVTRKSDLTKWKTAFPEAQVVMYRLDIPRECREEVTQVLDGYGPWGWNEDGKEFVETGRPLTVEEWDEETKSRVLKGGELPPEDKGLLDADEEESDDDEEEDSMYSQEAIRQREEQHRLLALYTPGHTFGSVTYVFPKRNICCSGFALPLESSSSIMDDDFDDDDDDDDNDGSIGRGTPPPIGPRLDYQGYLATSASRPRQMSSALTLINRYIDRFQVVLPARGDIVFLDSNEDTRKRELLESVGLYRKMSDIYGRLGIVD